MHYILELVWCSLYSAALLYYRHAVQLVPDIEYKVHSEDRPQHMREEGTVYMYMYCRYMYMYPVQGSLCLLSVHVCDY